ncbi:MAG: KOW domain-containing RNA-binding protein [Bacillota bacterium]|nr:KOW domain-containing RNA-binding protein [Bacillota bacterium]
MERADLRYRPGQLVVSRAGRDRGRAYLVVAVDPRWVYVADGSVRDVRHPKKKNPRHLAPTERVAEELAGLPPGAREWSNRKVREAIARLMGEPGGADSEGMATPLPDPDEAGEAPAAGSGGEPGGAG